MKYNLVMNLTTETPETTLSPSQEFALGFLEGFLPLFPVICFLLVVAGLMLTVVLLLSCRCYFQFLSCFHCFWQPIPKVSSDENLQKASAAASAGPSVLTMNMERSGHKIAAGHPVKVVLDTGNKRTFTNMEMLSCPRDYTMIKTF